MVGASAGTARIELRELLALAGLLACGALLLGRHLGAPSLEFDEGVYLLSVDLLERGLHLGQDVFSSQPPLFYALLDGASSVVGGSSAGLRAVTVLIALGGALAGWALVRGIAGPFPALAAAALVMLAPGVVDAAAVVSADVPSVAFGTAALLAFRAARGRPAWGAIAGALLACALLIKLLAVPFALAVGVSALIDRPPRRAVAWFGAGLFAVLGVVAAVYASALGELWRGAVELHADAQAAGGELPRPSIVAEVALITTAYLGLLAILAAGLRQVSPGGLGEWARARADLLAVLLGGLLLLAFNRPTLHHHLVIVAWPLALLAASTLPARLSPKVLAVAAVGALLVVPWAVRGRDTVEGATSDRIETVTALVERSTGPGETVVSDLPLVPLLAGRQAAATTVDPSVVRIRTGSLSREEIVAAADGAGAAVVGRSFAMVPGLDRLLERRFARVVEIGGVRVYLEPQRMGSRP